MFICEKYVAKRIDQLIFCLVWLRNQPFPKTYRNGTRKTTFRIKRSALTVKHCPDRWKLRTFHDNFQLQFFADRDNVWPLLAQYEGKLANSRYIFSTVSHRLFLYWPRDVISDITPTAVGMGSICGSKHRRDPSGKGVQRW